MTYREAAIGRSKEASDLRQRVTDGLQAQMHQMFSHGADAAGVDDGADSSSQGSGEAMPPCNIPSRKASCRRLDAKTANALDHVM